MAVTVTIDTVDRTSSVVFNSLRKIDNLNQQVDTLDFSVRKYGSLTYVPTIGQEVVVQSDSVTVFGGVIVRIEETMKSAAILEYNIKCADYAQYLKRELVTERYEGETVFDIVDDFVTTYASDFTTANVVVGPTIQSIAFNRITVAESLQKLADAIGYVWYVDYDKDIHFFPKNTELAPYSLSDTSGNYIYESLEITEDITQLRNVVLVQGGEQESAGTRTETFTGDGTRVQFALANKFSSLPTIVVNSVTQNVGVEFLDDDASFDVMWNYNEKYMRFTAGHTPANTHAITVTQKYLFPIAARVPSLASIGLFGTYEFAITDKSIISQDEAVERARAELASYQNQQYDGRFRTYEPGLRSGQVIQINSVQRDKGISVLIQSVSMAMRDPMGASFEYEVRFATFKNIGIIEFLQRQLRDREVIVDDSEQLLNLYEFNDTMTFVDSIDAPTFTTGPYKYGPHANAAVCGYSTWE
ncbi:hypothetical protein UFOVP594_16 [uncultured Caudovirales phage]|uniref:Uncharacterized protein n=1 Tax=uncultured Caudovirales phage TaxID=2100421 RepID=A0A6J5MYF5_9CAUD|nr:hypothetical protein UFOVP594_16 [uncultured Caudovirales phage]